MSTLNKVCQFEKRSVSSHPTVLVFVEKLGRDRCRVSCFGSHFIPKLSTQRDIDELVLDAFTVQDSDDVGLL